MKKSLFISFGIITITLSTFQAIGIPTPPVENTQLLQKSVHLDVVILLDESEAFLGESDAAMAYTFLSLTKDLVPFIANKSIFTVVLNPSEQWINKYGPTSFKDYVIYENRTKDFVLGLPKSYYPSSKINVEDINELYRLGLNKDQLIKVESFNNFKYIKLKQMPPIRLENLKLLFLDNNNNPINMYAHKRIYLTGHGLVQTLTEKKYVDLLSFFNNQSTDILVLNSCFGGSFALENAKREAANIQKAEQRLNLNYFLIHTGFPETVTYTADYGISLKLFFKNSNELFSPQGPKNINLTNVIKPLINPYIPSEQLFSVKFPGENTYFKPINIDKHLEIISYSKEKKHHIAKKSFEIDENKIDILIYPNVINVPVILKGSQTPRFISMINGGSIQSLVKVQTSQELTSLCTNLFFKQPTSSTKGLFIKSLICKAFEKDNQEINDLMIFKVPTWPKPRSLQVYGMIFFKYQENYYTCQYENNKLESPKLAASAFNYSMVSYLATHANNISPEQRGSLQDPRLLYMNLLTSVQQVSIVGDVIKKNDKEALEFVTKNQMPHIGYLFYIASPLNWRVPGYLLRRATSK